jgi:hypothetical protein
MIEVHSPPVIEPDPRGGWQLVFWMGKAFDNATPFRTALKDMTEVLGRDDRCSILLPEYELHEDFVEGTMQFGDQALRVYYEHALSYLSLSAGSRETLSAVAARIETSMK